MFNWKRLLCTAFILILVALLFALPGCTSNDSNPENVQVYIPVTQPGPQFTVDLSLSDDPELDRPVQAKAVFQLTKLNLMDPPVDITGRILLPDSFVLADGSLSANKKMGPGDILELEATIKAIKICEDCEIKAVPYWNKDSGEYPRGFDTVYVYVFSDRAFRGNTLSEIGFHPPGQVSPRWVLPPPDEQVMVIKMSLSCAPALGETAELTLSATATKDAPGAWIYFNLPEELELISGDSRWEGDLHKGDQVELTATIKASKTGVCSFSAIGHYRLSPDSSSVAYVYQIRLYIFEDGAEVFHILPHEHIEPEKPPAEYDEGGIAPEPVLPPPSSG